MASFVPSIALLLCAAHIKGHHAPGQVGHALCVGELRLGPRVELPYLRAQGIVLLQLRRRLGAHGTGVVAKGCEDGLVEHAARRRRRAALAPHVEIHGCSGRRGERDYSGTEGNVPVGCGANCDPRPQQR
jgi:hypothetical protein